MTVWGYVFVGLFGSMMLFVAGLSAWGLWAWVRLRRVGVPADGVVVDYRTIVADTRPRRLGYNSIIEFRVPGHPKPYHVMRRLGGTAKTDAIGDRHRVIYDPAYPKRAALGTGAELLIGNVAGLVLSVLFLAMMVAGVVLTG